VTRTIIEPVSRDSDPVVARCDAMVLAGCLAGNAGHGHSHVPSRDLDPAWQLEPWIDGTRARTGCGTACGNGLWLPPCAAVRPPRPEGATVTVTCRGPGPAPIPGPTAAEALATSDRPGPPRPSAGPAAHGLAHGGCSLSQAPGPPRRAQAAGRPGRCGATAGGQPPLPGPVPVGAARSS
jgi:hypothetical protein